MPPTTDPGVLRAEQRAHTRHARTAVADVAAVADLAAKLRELADQLTAQVNTAGHVEPGTLSAAIVGAVELARQADTATRRLVDVARTVPGAPLPWSYIGNLVGQAPQNARRKYMTPED
jgi:hypothetical protein